MELSVSVIVGYGVVLQWATDYGLRMTTRFHDALGLFGSCGGYTLGSKSTGTKVKVRNHGKRRSATRGRSMIFRQSLRTLNRRAFDVIFGQRMAACAHTPSMNSCVDFDFTRASRMIGASLFVASRDRRRHATAAAPSATPLCPGPTGSMSSTK